MQKKKRHRDFILFTKINPKWIADLNVKLKTIKLLEGNRRKTTWFGYGHDFLDRTSKA